MSTILITGAAAGLGLAISQALITAGHEVIPFDIKHGQDVRNPAMTWGDIPPDADVLINCAGVNVTGWLENVTENDWDYVMDVNAKGIYKMTRWMLPVLARNQ